MQTPEDKRAPRPFEPPPWEREQFEGLARGQGGEDPPAPPEPDAPQEATAASQPASTEERSEGAKAAGDNGVESPSEAQMDAMVIGLGAEEGPSSRSFFGCGVAASIVSAFTGTVVLVYSVVVYVRTSSAGALAVVGPMALAMTGLAILGSSLWLAVRTYNRRGA